MESEDGGSGVYLIVTFRFDFHIGRLECVTCQVSDSHGMVGIVKLAGAAAAENVGGRIVMLAIMGNLICHSLWQFEISLHSTG